MTIQPDMNAGSVTANGQRIWPIYTITARTGPYGDQAIMRITSLFAPTGLPPDIVREAAKAAAQIIFDNWPPGPTLVRLTVAEAETTSRLVFDESGPVPEITEVIPGAARGDSQARVTVKGRNLVDPAGVYFVLAGTGNGLPATSVVGVDPETVTCTIPTFYVQSPQTVPVRVVLRSLLEARIEDGFTYTP
jgi:hypothetical protein